MSIIDAIPQYIERDTTTDEGVGMTASSVPARGTAGYSRPMWEVVLSVGVLGLFLMTVPSTPIVHEKSVYRRPRAPKASNVVARPVKPLIIGPLVGSEASYTARRPERLVQIARKNNTDRITLARINGIDTNTVRAGRTLRLPTVHVLPCVPHDGVVLNIPERGVYLFRNGRFIKRYPVAVGAKTWETPTGAFRIVRKVIRPAWIPPAVMVKREKVPAVRIPPGESNPLGDRWIGWSAPEVGFHGTPIVESIGSAASHACVRLYPEAAHHMFARVYRGMPIYSVYEPILVGRRGDSYYLSVSADIYGRGLASLERARKRLVDAGLWDRVDHEKVRRIVARQEGYPYELPVSSAF
jgi:L,D-transpeptidase ErfK/SrfK